eukprot:668639_1
MKKTSSDGPKRMKRTLPDYFNIDDGKPDRKRMKLCEHATGDCQCTNIPPAIQNPFNTMPSTPNTQDIKNRSKQRIDELKQTKLTEQKEEQMKQSLRESIRPIIQQKAKKAHKDPIKLIQILCPDVHIDTANITSRSHIKKAFKKALVHCHPDKVLNKTLRERVECEEIFKILCTHKQIFEKNSDPIRNNDNNKGKRHTNHSFTDKIWVSSEHCFDVTVSLSSDKKMVYVKGETFPIKEQLKQCGLGWNPKQIAWQIKTPYFTEFMREQIEKICKAHGMTVSIGVDDSGCINVRKEDDKRYDFRIWFEQKDGTMFVTSHRKMNAFWRNEGFIRLSDGMWMQSECVFYEGYVTVIKEVAQTKGLVFGYCDVQKNPQCGQCKKQMRPYTTRNGAPWNIGRKFFRCWKCDSSSSPTDSLGSFMWIDGTGAYSEAAFRRCGEFNDCARFGYDANECTTLNTIFG